MEGVLGSTSRARNTRAVTRPLKQVEQRSRSSHTEHLNLRGFKKTFHAGAFGGSWRP